MAWKQSEAADVMDTPAIHEGEGVITRRRFFRDTTRLPVPRRDMGTAAGRE